METPSRFGDYSPFAVLFSTSDRATATHIAYQAAPSNEVVVPFKDGLPLFALLQFLSWPELLKLGLRHLVRQDRTYLTLNPMLEGVVSSVKNGERIILRMGTPGPWSKVTAFVLSADGSPAAIVKIGTTPTARALLRNEARWLIKLTGDEEIQKRVPGFLRLKDEGELTTLTQRVVPGRRARSFGESHANFLKSLHKIAPIDLPFSRSSMYAAMVARATRIQDSLPAEWKHRVSQAFEVLIGNFGDSPLRMALAHRDFTTWNIRLSSDCIRVFDWEYASEGYLQSYDFNHYHLLPLALKHGAIKKPEILLNNTARALGDFTADCVTRKSAFMHLLGYMLDLSLMYMDSRGGWDHRDQVVANYGQLIDSALKIR